MNRILFAAGRGARVQMHVTTDATALCSECGRNLSIHGDSILPFNDDMALAIHPDDEALQFGPVSSALREMATGDYEPSEYILAASGIANYLYPSWQYQWGEDRLHRSLFLLILSECLAEEGL